MWRKIGSVPHCSTPGAVSRGKARGQRRYQCKGCRETFNAATGTALAGLHRKDKWLAFGACIADGQTVRALAARCGFAVTTAFRWRHRFLAAQGQSPRTLTGIVEADETYILASCKGQRNLGRKARSRGGKADNRGLSDEQVLLLVVSERGGAIVSAVVPAVNADALREVIEPIVAGDIMLISDGHRIYPFCATAIGVCHEALSLFIGERWRAHAQRLSHSERQQPAQLVEGFPAALSRYRNQISRQLPAVVSVPCL